jgi:flagellar biosynthesis/type III secretory pathway protein FliH
MGRITKLRDRRSQPIRFSAESREAAAILIAAHSRADALRRDAKQEIIDLALFLAKQIIGCAVEMDSSYLDSIYSRALKATRDLGPSIVYVNSEDRAVSRIDELARASGFEVAEDPDTERAGCRVRSGDVEVSLTLDDALKALETAMKGLESA